MASSTLQGGVLNVSPPIAKVVMIGDYGTGKTSFLNRFTTNKYSLNYKSNIGADFFTKEVSVSNTSIVIQLWDIAGSERYGTVSPIYYRGADGFLVFFDVTNRKSFKNVLQHMEDFSEFTTERTRTCIIGTKIDLADKREVSYNEALELAKHVGAKYFEASAKENINVKEAVQSLVEGIVMARRTRAIVVPPDGPIDTFRRPPRHCFCTIL